MFDPNEIIVVDNICRMKLYNKNKEIAETIFDFKYKDDAARAYNSAAIKYFGEFAKLNIV